MSDDEEGRRKKSDRGEKVEDCRRERLNSPGKEVTTTPAEYGREVNTDSRRR
jgi:hypothetical protein